MFSEAPKPTAENSLDNDQRADQSLQSYLIRFIFMGCTIALLTAVVVYLYLSKISHPLSQLENNVKTDLVTTPLAMAKSEQTLPASPKIAHDSSFAPALEGLGVNCPSGTTRMIYIDEQALCCSGTVCKASN